MLIFPPFENVVHLFYKAGGVTLTAVRSPRRSLDDFRAAFPIETARELKYLAAPVELVETQNYVSVRGTDIAGHEFEWPEPENRQLNLPSP